jgi:hypothetical protein
MLIILQHFPAFRDLKIKHSEKGDDKLHLSSHIPHPSYPHQYGRYLSNALIILQHSFSLQKKRKPRAHNPATAFRHSENLKITHTEKGDKQLLAFSDYHPVVPHAPRDSLSSLCIITASLLLSVFASKLHCYLLVLNENKNSQGPRQENPRLANCPVSEGVLARRLGTLRSLS